MTSADPRQLPMLPRLPDLRDVTRALRDAQLNAPLQGWWVGFTVDREGWRLTADDTEKPLFGRELVPHRNRRFDAIAAARRLLFAVDDACNPRRLT